MSAKRPLIKYKDRNGKVQIRKLPPCSGNVWTTFNDIHCEISKDVNIKNKYQYNDIVEIIFEFKNKNKGRQRRYKDEIVE